jgi:hypothetical protein
MRSFMLSFLWAGSIAAFSLGASLAIDNKEPPLLKGSFASTPMVLNEAQANEKEAQHYNKNALHRLDFRIQGKSCAICLMGIQRRIKAVTGALKVAVMLKKPYGASIIYDASQVTEQTLIDTAKLNEPLIKLLEVSDAPIEKIPLVLIPPHASMESSSNSALLPIH